MVTETTTAPVYTINKADKKFIGWHVFFAVAALTIGSLFGPLQALQQAGIDWYPSLDFLFISISDGPAAYYQGLTLHGVLNALIWTTFFITGFTTLAVIRGLKRDLAIPMLNRVGFWMMVVGLVVAAIPLLADNASVLYTFYPPMQADSLFYIGLVLVVVGSWIEGYGFYITLYRWRKENPGEKTPLIVLAVVLNMVMWQIATLGIAAEVLGLILPWTFSLTNGIDPQLSRTFFWFTGHPLVYFWLLPAYASWYTMLPKQAGGKLFSDTLARLAFWLFLIPVRSARVPPSVRGSRCSCGLEVHSLDPDSGCLLPIAPDVLHRRCLAGVRSSTTRREGPARLDKGAAVERSVGDGSAPGRHPVHVRRDQRSRQCLVQREPRLA